MHNKWSNKFKTRIQKYIDMMEDISDLLPEEPEGYMQFEELRLYNECIIRTRTKLTKMLAELNLAHKIINKELKDEEDKIIADLLSGKEVSYNGIGKAKPGSKVKLTTDTSRKQMVKAIIREKQRIGDLVDPTEIEWTISVIYDVLKGLNDNDKTVSQLMMSWASELKNKARSRYE